MGLTWIIEKIYVVHTLKLINLFQRAEVAELVDALGSGSSARMSMGVRVSPSAPTFLNPLFLQRVFVFYKAAKSTKTKIETSKFHLLTQFRYSSNRRS